MAREVNTVLAQIIAEQRGVPESKANCQVYALSKSIPGTCFYISTVER
jgi:hypothetical protein